MRTSPFHDRLAPLNETELWEHWSGYLSAIKYQHSATVEYFAARDAVGVFDTSPLFKYRITGTDSTSFLSGVFVRDIAGCAVGRAQYTLWCNDAGYVLEDGVVLHVAADEYWLTSTRRNLAYLSRLVGSCGVVVEDVSDDFGVLAVQGPHSLNVLAAAIDGSIELEYFGVTSGSIGGHTVTISRTGFTGDLGYEIWVEAAAAGPVWDALMEVGAGYNIIPMGALALSMARLDGGLLLLGTDFESARFAWTDAERETPDELGLGWMVPKQTDRAYPGKEAIEAERRDRTSRWKTVGVIVDAAAYERTFNDAGLIAPKEGVYRTGSLSLYDADFNESLDANYVGYMTSFMFSPVLKRHIGLAKVPLDRAAPGSELFLELTVSHRPKYVRAEVTRTPFYNPPRKTAPPRNVKDGS